MLAQRTYGARAAPLEAGGNKASLVALRVARHGIDGEVTEARLGGRGSMYFAEVRAARRDSQANLAGDLLGPVQPGFTVQAEQHGVRMQAAETLRDRARDLR